MKDEKPELISFSQYDDDQILNPILGQIVYLS